MENLCFRSEFPVFDSGMMAILVWVKIIQQVTKISAKTPYSFADSFFSLISFQKYFVVSSGFF